MGHSRPLFLLLLPFQYTVDSKQMFNIKINFCQWLDSNHGPLVSEATALPTEPQPLPNVVHKFMQKVFFIGSVPTGRANLWVGKSCKKQIHILFFSFYLFLTNSLFICIPFVATKLFFVIVELSPLFWYFINRTSNHFGRYEPSYPLKMYPRDPLCFH